VNIAIAKKWVEALRSGKYKQIFSRLHTNTGFCCLGVLCDIVKDEVRGHWEEYPTDAAVSGTRKFVVPHAKVEEICPLPITVRNYTGMKSAFGTFIADTAGNIKSLAGLNDQGASFEEIADIIEKHAEQL
jgi:hypothetical protein